jgi:hypothetical protein
MRAMHVDDAREQGEYSEMECGVGGGEVNRNIKKIT